MALDEKQEKVILYANSLAKLQKEIIKQKKGKSSIGFVASKTGEGSRERIVWYNLAMTEQGSHFEYAPEFVDDINQRNNWTVVQWKKVTAEWEDTDIQNFSLLLELDKDQVDELAMASYQTVKEWEGVDLRSFSTESIDMIHEVVEEAAFFATYGNISNEARERIFEALTS